MRRDESRYRSERVSVDVCSLLASDVSSQLRDGWSARWSSTRRPPALVSFLPSCSPAPRPNALARCSKRNAASRLPTRPRRCARCGVWSPPTGSLSSAPCAGIPRPRRCGKSWRNEKKVKESNPMGRNAREVCFGRRPQPALQSFISICFVLLSAF